MDEKIDGPEPVTPLSEVESELCTLAGQIAAASCRFLELVAEFDRREGWAGAGITSCAHWLSWRCGLDLRTAREHVRVARSLVDLDVVRETFAEGRLSYSKVRAIARVATPTNERDLVEAGLHAPASTLERLTRGLGAAADNARKDAKQGVRARGVRPDGSTPGMPKPRDDADDDRAYLQWRWDDRGRLVLWGRLDPVEGAILLAATARIEAALVADADADADAGAGADGSAEPSCPGAADCRPPSNLAPALTAMAQTTMIIRELPRFSPAAEVTVLVGIDELQEALAETTGGATEPPPPGTEPPGTEPPGTETPGTATPARLQDGPALRRAALRRLVDDGRLRTESPRRVRRLTGVRPPPAA